MVFRCLLILETFTREKNATTNLRSLPPKPFWQNISRTSESRRFD